jgi:hypothetical protein
MRVDEARRRNLASGVDLHVGACLRKWSDPDDPVAAHADVTGVARCRGAVHHRGVANQQVIVFGHL